MKVVFITENSLLYGSNRSLLDLIDGLKEFRVESFVLCPSKGKMIGELEKRNIPVCILPFKRWMGKSRTKALARLALNLAILPFGIRQVTKWNADIIHTNDSCIPIGAWIATILKKPHIWHIRKFGFLDFQLKYDWGEKCFKYWLNKADAVIAVSKAVEKIVLNGVNTKTYIVYNGVISRAECNALKEKALLFNRPSNYTFAIIGFLTPTKRQEHAIRAVAHLKKDYPDIRLLIVGSGHQDYLKFLKKLTKDLDVEDNVEFWGYISNPFDAYLKADAGLMCSKYEAFGRVTAEAMAACRPVIGYNAGGTVDIIENEVTGLLYNGGYENLAYCMRRFIENPKWVRQLGINGWEKAQRKYTIEVCAKGVYNVLCEVLGRN